MLIENLLEPTIDYVFKRIFGHVGNERITADLLSNILQEKIEDINLDCNTFINKDITDDKVGILDVKVKFSGGVTCDLEMQVVENSNIYKRILYYWSKLYAQNIKQGKDYHELERCIVVLIADFELDDLKEIPQYITRWKIKEEKYGKHVLTDLLEICIIELPKMQKYSENSDLDMWVKFIKKPEVINVENKETNEAVKEAKKVLEEISNDEHERELAELRQKYIMDQKAIQDFGIEKGLKEGLEQGIRQGMKQGMEQGIKQGIEQGIEQGIKQGIEQEKTELIKKMLKENIDIQTISKITGLTEEEIKNLQ